MIAPALGYPLDCHVLQVQLWPVLSPLKVSHLERRSETLQASLVSGGPFNPVGSTRHLERKIASRDQVREVGVEVRECPSHYRVRVRARSTSSMWQRRGRLSSTHVPLRSPRSVSLDSPACRAHARHAP